jgi:hypothetical protein
MSLGFPHSEIFGSKVARHLPEAYRRHATSFIAVLCQGIHHMPLYIPLGNIKTTITFICYLPAASVLERMQRFVIRYVAFSTL